MLAHARRQLAGSGIASAALDARLLLCAAAGLSHEALVRAPEHRLTGAETDVLRHFLARRMAGEPVARILGTREFWGLDFHLDPATLVPRPDSETVVAAACEVLRAQANEAPLIADLGTGSGCLAIAILSELPQAMGVACDIAPQAAIMARHNATRLGVGARLLCLCADWAAALRGPFDVIVTNPPYIESSAIAALEREVACHDPWRALDGGADGLDTYRKIMPQAFAALRPGGYLIAEFGAGQGEAVLAAGEAAGLARPAGDALKADLAGRPRAALMIKPG